VLCPNHMHMHGHGKDARLFSAPSHTGASHEIINAQPLRAVVSRSNMYLGYNDLGSITSRVCQNPIQIRLK
jgi:hypothetical protein